MSQNVKLNAQLRTTCVATLISGGHAQNALPQRAKATIQCRMMPGDTAENVQTLLTTTLADPRISITLDAPPILSPESPAHQRDHGRGRQGRALHVAERADHSNHGQWVQRRPPDTDRRDTTYDLSGLWADVDDNRAHGRDERIGVREFDESVEYTYRLMKAFATR